MKQCLAHKGSYRGNGVTREKKGALTSRWIRSETEEKDRKISGKCKRTREPDVGTTGLFAVSLTMGILIEFQVDLQTER